MWREIKTIVLIGVCSAVWVAYIFINPYEGNIDLSELILQLSGSAGEFCLGTSLPELIGFMLRMLPNYIIMLVLGINIYRYFCTASVYIFSRCSKRYKWYMKIIFYLFVEVLIYEIIFVATAILITVLRYEVVIDYRGFYVSGYHIFLYTIWNLAWILLINICAIKKGSSNSFLMAIGIQIFFTASLNIITILESYNVPDKIIERIINFNPVAHTVLGWHSGVFFNERLMGNHHSMDMSETIVLILIFGISTVLIGNILIQRHDLLVENIEIGVM